MILQVGSYRTYTKRDLCSLSRNLMCFAAVGRVNSTLPPTNMTARTVTYSERSSVARRYNPHTLTLLSRFFPLYLIRLPCLGSL